jgi:hypothetical protein
LDLDHLSGLTVIIIGQEETTTTSDPSTATLLHIRLPRQNSASTETSRAGEKSPGVPGFGHARFPISGKAWPYYRPESRTLRFPGDEKLRRWGEVSTRERESERSE